MKVTIGKGRVSVIGTDSCGFYGMLMRPTLLSQKKKDNQRIVEKLIVI